MRRKTDLTGFRFKLFTFFTVLTLLITLAFSFLYVHSEIQAQQKRSKERAELLAMHLAGSIRLPLFAENSDMLQQIISSETAQYQDICAITISTNDARVLLKFVRPAIPDPDNRLSTSLEVYSNPLSFSPESALTSSEESAGTRVGLLQLSLDISEMSENISNLTMTAVITAFLFWISVSLFGYFGLEKVTHSFKTLMEGLNTIKTGDYDIRIPVESDDEPGRAAAAVNSLAESLRSRQQENIRLQDALVNSMRLEVQEEKKQMMARLIQTNRMTFLGLLASSMAHEINNPNASIRLAGLFLSRAWGDAFPLLQQTARDEGNFSLGGIPFTMAQNEILQCCATIERSTDNISHVVQDLRTYSLGQSSEFMPNVNINQVVNDSISIIRAYGRHPDVNISVDTQQNVPLVNGIKHQLEQVVVNLILNAMQAMSGTNGTIAIRTAHSTKTDQVLIAIRDEGEGIPQENLEHLTEPFFSTRISKGGSGLGLFVANHIINEHQGTLKFISKPGSGTTVSILLPVYKIQP